MNDCTLTVNGPHSFNSLVVTNGGVMTHSPSVYNSVTNRIDLTIATDVLIGSGSKIDVSGKGYGGGTGPGAGRRVGQGGGGGYGGQGGNSTDGAGGSTYGSVTDPGDVGSGGGNNYADLGGGAGGGALRLVVAGALRVDGVVQANGADGLTTGGNCAGGGSGGMIKLRVGSLAGDSTGLIQAKGGNGASPYGGGGGGGRIALYLHCLQFVGGVQDGGGTGYQNGATGTVYVAYVNAAPVLPNQADVTLNELAMLTVTNTAFDPDCPANAQAYSLEIAPPGADISPDGVITWTPTEAQGPGTYVFKTVVTDYNPQAAIDQHLSATNVFTVTVNEVNTPPSVSLPASVAVDEMTPLNVTATATDVDLPGNSLHFALLEGPPGLQVAEDTGLITWLPGESDGPGAYNVTIKVTDDNPWAANEQHLSATNSVLVTLNEVNRPPVFLTEQTNRVIGQLTLLAVTNTASDPDLPANTLTYDHLDSNPVTGPRQLSHHNRRNRLQPAGGELPAFEHNE